MGLGSGVIVLGAVSSGVSSVATGLSKLGGVFAALKNTVVAALGGISATVLAVVAVVLSAIIAVWQRSEEFRNNFSVMIQSIVTLLSQFAETFQALFTLVGEFLAMWWDSTSIVLNGAFEWLLNTIVNIVTAITDALTGLLTFLEGIFTGDLDKAREGIKMIIQSVIYAIVTLVVGALNGLISVVFLAINGIGNTIYTFLCGVVRMVNLFGGLIGIQLEYPDKSLFVIEDIPQIPMPSLEFANGGVVTGPTYAMIGEGLYNEAVIPLGNSPQMQELLEQFASIVTNRGFVEPVEVRVFIGDKEWDAFTYESAERGKELVGATPVKERS